MKWRKKNILRLSKTTVKTIPKHKKAGHDNQHHLNYLILTKNFRANAVEVPDTGLKITGKQKELNIHQYFHFLF